MTDYASSLRSQFHYEPWIECIPETLFTEEGWQVVKPNQIPESVEQSQS